MVVSVPGLPAATQTAVRPVLVTDWAKPQARLFLNQQLVAKGLGLVEDKDWEKVYEVGRRVP